MMNQILIIINIDSDRPELYILRAKLFEKIQAYDKAINDYDRVIEIDTTNYEALNNKGVVYENIEKYDSAIACYDKALKIAATFFKNYDIPTGIPDKDMIFWFKDKYAAIWINTIEEIRFV